MKHKTTVGVIGLVGASALVIVVAATSLGGSRDSEPPPDRRSVADRGRDPTAPTAATVAPTDSASPTAAPDRDPAADPAARPGSADRPAGHAGGRGASPDRGDDRRPRGRPAAVRACRRRRSSGRHRPRAGSRGTWRSSRTPCRRRSGRSAARAILHRLGRRVARRLRPFRRLAAGQGDARRQGPRPVRLQRRRVPLQRHLLPGHHPGGAAQPVHAPARKLRAHGQDARAPRTGPTPPPGSSRPMPRSRPGRTAARSPSAIRTTRSSTRTTGTSNTYLRSVTGEKKETDALDGTRIAPKNVIVMRMVFGPLNDGHPGAPRLEANVVGHGTGLDLDQRPDHQGNLEEDRVHRADPVLRRERQAGHADRRPDVRPGGHDEHDRLSGHVQGRLDQPPATPSPSSGG